jgi:hypothetical protein
LLGEHSSVLINSTKDEIPHHRRSIAAGVCLSSTLNLLTRVISSLPPFQQVISSSLKGNGKNNAPRM